MYDELVSALRECSKQGMRYGMAVIYMGQAADDIEELQGKAKVLEKLADHWCNKAPKWIPVTERLPENEEVLCINDYSFYMVGWLYCDDAGNYTCESDNESMNDVTHWMPLPHSPESGGE